MLVQCDAKQLEWRCILDLSGDSTGIDEVLRGSDVHGLNEAAFKLPSRLIAKKYLFRTIFRGSGYAFSKDPEFKHVSQDPDYWDRINHQFYRKYSGIDRCHNQWAERVALGQPLIGPSGREWLIPMGVDRKGNREMPWPKLTNSPVQGTSADIMAVARVSLRNRLRDLRSSCLLVGTVHDSIVVDTKLVDKTAELMYSVFDDLPKNFLKLFGYKMKLPYAAEIKVGDNLTDMEEYKK